MRYVGTHRVSLVDFGRAFARAPAILTTALRTFVTVGMTAAGLLLPSHAGAQTYEVVFPFTSPWVDGGNPTAGLLQGDDGALYGVTPVNGLYGQGTVFRVNSSGSLTTLWQFDCCSGKQPQAALIEDKESPGIFYGTTQFGGTYDEGTVFQIDTSGSLTTLHSFEPYAEGGQPLAALVEGSDRNLYGTGYTDDTSGIGNGTVFGMTKSGSLTMLYRFQNLADGGYPHAPLLEVSDGIFFGATTSGGANNDGTFFEIDAASPTPTPLHSFDDHIGFFGPTRGLVKGNGFYYGTSTGSGQGDWGTVFRIDGSGNLTTLYTFSGGDDGADPQGNLVLGSDGNLYGVTAGVDPQLGVSAWRGTIFQITTSGELTTLYTFSGGDGQYPNGGLIQANDGRFYGTTQAGGPDDGGVIFRLTVPLTTVTPAGSSVTVTEGNVMATFAAVSAGGTATVTPIDPATAGTLPAGGYSLSSLGFAYEISTTATISGTVIVAITVPASVDEVTFDTLRILHGENGSLVDRTYISQDGCTATALTPCPAPNFATRTLYAQVSSLSPFVLATIPNPFVKSLTVPTSPVAVSTALNVQGTFTGLGTHTASWSWGDGSNSTGAVSESGGIGTVTGSHAYSAAGVYVVTLTVSDSGGISGQRVSPYVVVYDPSAGFVTGGGWFNSPAGAFIAQPTATGQATFGFVAKYTKNSNIPTGQAEFHFSSLNLNSSSYDWLVITGAKAQVQGSGTVNGAGNYGFKLTVIDGQASGGGGTDKIRIKIWDKNSGNAIVYDNQMGAPDSANPTTAIGNGSIVLH